MNQVKFTAECNRCLSLVTKDQSEIHDNKIFCGRCCKMRRCHFPDCDGAFVIECGGGDCSNFVCEKHCRKINLKNVRSDNVFIYTRQCVFCDKCINTIKCRVCMQIDNTMIFQDRFHYYYYPSHFTIRNDRS